MYLLITYDVCTSSAGGASRLRLVAKVCQDYGQRVQNSVFECLVSPTQKAIMEDQLMRIINEEEDSLRIYHIGDNYDQKITVLGKQTSFDVEGELFV